MLCSRWKLSQAKSRRRAYIFAGAGGDYSGDCRGRSGGAHTSGHAVCLIMHVTDADVNRVSNRPGHIVEITMHYSASGRCRGGKGKELLAIARRGGIVVGGSAWRIDVDCCDITSGTVHSAATGDGGHQQHGQRDRSQPANMESGIVHKSSVSNAGNRLAAYKENSCSILR